MGLDEPRLRRLEEREVMTPRAKYIYGPCLVVGILALWTELIGVYVGAPRIIFAACGFFGAGILTVIGVGNFICDYLLKPRAANLSQ